MSRRHGDYSSVREAILATAASLFTRRGVHSTSLGDIAAEAQLSKGTLYYYYPSKEELIYTIASDCLSHMTDIMLAWVDSLNRDEPLRPAVIRLFEQLTADAHYARLYTVLCAECTTEDTQLSALMAERRQKWKVMLEVGVLKAQSRNTALIGDGAELFFTLLSGYMLQSLSGMSSIPVETLADALLRD